MPNREDLFTNRPPNAEQGEALDAITAYCRDFAEALNEMLPPSRYHSLAMTKLEETSMWAKKAVLFS